MIIALIEDTPVNLLIMQSLVKRLEAHDCSVFSDPELGLAWCLDNEPDLIIVDYMMPRLDGLEFIRRCRATPALRERPILMVTAAADKEVRYAALEAGATDFLTKPIDKHEFIPRVRNMLALRAAMAASTHRADELAIAVRQATEEIYQRERETIMRLARAAEFRDPETGAHILRMAHYSATIARHLGLPEETVSLLLSAAPMHDVGKLGTPDHILLKPGRLTPEEMAIMRQHAVIGYEILCNSSSPMLQIAAEIALSHHEKYDGSGYPAGKSGEDIPLMGRIVAVADVFDALTSDRPYKQAWTLEQACEYLRAGRGTHFDPVCVDLFLEHWEEVLDIHSRYQD
ncbi:response regulator [Uliginosibacterium sp. 31-16]|uniref:HD domain-containing phosphohydrolase n=1 Tax=Uliginosibacterium sp. 31-16 TaxID=3068315 RepID=UPI00273F5633|nr:HD domain-containing phosphohydrolase [Uliginosibacterium sp. 31-16]MDP5240937.1 response regulator [Uliginosibacterium sp. 31-16]